MKVAIFDVDGAPIKNCTARCFRSGMRLEGSPGPNGNDFTFSSFFPLSEVIWTVVVSHHNFFEETTDINPVRITWTNPTCSISVSTLLFDTIISVRFVLSRIRLAPREYIPDPKLTELTGAPNGVLLADERLAPRQQLPFPYRALFTDTYDVYRLDHPTLPAKPGAGWARFRHKVVKADPLQYGSFRWLEYGSGTTRYAIAVWIPWDYIRGNTSKQLDFIIFYSPTTANRSYVLNTGQTYPYGLRGPEGGRYQPFMGLGHLYLFNGNFLCYQLVAARKKAIMVMPINNAGEWGPFATGPGLYRTLEEIAHYVSKLRKKMMQHAPTHTVHTATVAAYSSGLGALTPLLDDATKNGQQHDLFYTSRPSAFNDCWKELWDIDLDLPGVVGDFEGNYMKWLQGGANRQFRMYHSEFTSGRWRPTIGPILSKIKDIEVGVTSTTNGDIAEEIHSKDGRWSAVYFSNRYLEYDVSLPKSAIPGLLVGDPHHFIPKIALAHAALKSKLARL